MANEAVGVADARLHGGGSDQVHVQALGTATGTGRCMPQHVAHSNEDRMEPTHRTGAEQPDIDRHTEPKEHVHSNCSELGPHAHCLNAAAAADNDVVAAPAQ